jgi:hypothetical protein
MAWLARKGSIACLVGSALVAAGCTAPTVIVGVLYGVRTPERARSALAGSAQQSASARTRVVGYVALELALERVLDRSLQHEAPPFAGPAIAQLAPAECEVESLCTWQDAARLDAEHELDPVLESEAELETDATEEPSASDSALDDEGEEPPSQ